MDRLNEARKKYAELQEMVKKAGGDPVATNTYIKAMGLQDLVKSASSDPQARRALEQKLSEAAARDRRKAQGPTQTGDQDRSQARRERSQAQRNQGNAPREAPPRVLPTRPSSVPPLDLSSNAPGTFLGLDAERFRQAFIIKEILSPPPSMRDDDDF